MTFASCVFIGDVADEVESQDEQTECQGKKNMETQPLSDNPPFYGRIVTTIGSMTSL